MKHLYKNKKGQILVEYLLLLTIAVGCATLMTKGLVSREEGNPGIIIRAWDSLLKSLANDLPDCSSQESFSTANCPE